MIRSILWVGGWASPMECWREPLEALHPGARHFFLDGHQAARDPEALDRSLASLPSPALVAAWSMGSLAAHRRLTSRNFCREIPLLSLCPIFAFTERPGKTAEQDAEGRPSPAPPGRPQQDRLPSATLRAMRLKLDRDRESVLRDFWDAMAGGAADPAARSVWLAGAAAHTAGTLREGLAFLETTSVAPGQVLGLAGRMVFMASPRDSVAGNPFRQAGVAALPPDKTVLIGDHGHLPFLESPGRVREALAMLGAA